MIQMRTWLTVADNSGARKLTCIMPVAATRLAGGPGRRHHRRCKGSDTGKPGQERNGSEGSRSADAKERRRKDGTYIRLMTMPRC